MRRLLLVTSVLCAIDTTQAFAQHEVSQQLLELEEADRNTFFTMQLRGSNKRCDQVIRPLFNAAYLDVDEWEALCRDHNSYSLNVPCRTRTRRSHRCIAVSCPRQTRCCCKALAVGTRRAAAGSKASGESDIDLVRSRLIARRAKHFEDGQGSIIAAHRLAIDQAGPDLRWFTASTTSG